MNNRHCKNIMGCVDIHMTFQPLFTFLNIRVNGKVCSQQEFKGYVYAKINFGKAVALCLSDENHKNAYNRRNAHNMNTGETNGEKKQKVGSECWLYGDNQSHEPNKFTDPYFRHEAWIYVQAIV